jgi:hypothetical protein
MSVNRIPPGTKPYDLHPASPQGGARTPKPQPQSVDPKTVPSDRTPQSLSVQSNATKAALNKRLDETLIASALNEPTKVANASPNPISNFPLAPDVFSDGKIIGGNGKAYDPPNVPLGQSGIPAFQPQKPRPGDETVLFVGGIRRNKGDGAASGQLVANTLGRPTYGVHNATGGLDPLKIVGAGLDLSESTRDIAEMEAHRRLDPSVKNAIPNVAPGLRLAENAATQSLTDTLERELQTGKPVRIVAESQGAIITSNAISRLHDRLVAQNTKQQLASLRTLAEAKVPRNVPANIREAQIQQEIARQKKLVPSRAEAYASRQLSKISVETYGGAASYFPNGPQYTHYVNPNDPISTNFGQLSSGAVPGRNAKIVEFDFGKGNPLAAHNFEEYLSRREPDKLKLNQVISDVGKLNPRQVNEKILAVSEPQLLQALKNGSLPGDVSKALNQVLGKDFNFNADARFKAARTKLSGEINEAVGRNIRDHKQLAAVLSKVQEPGSRGSIGEEFYAARLGGAAQVRKPTFTRKDFDPTATTPQAQKETIQPDFLRTRAGRTVDIKTGYQGGLSDIQQIKDYERLIAASQKPGAAQSGLSGLGVPGGKLNGHDYVFLPNGRAGYNARQAAVNAYESVKANVEAKSLDKFNFYYQGDDGNIYRYDGKTKKDQLIGKQLPN